MAKYVKPTLKTKFHIDFSWWQEEGRNLRSRLLEHACPECRELLEADPTIKTMDWVDPETGRVFTIDQAWHLVRERCADDPNYLDEQLALVASVFRLFIITNNSPLTPVEMHQRLSRKSAGLILRTIGGHRTYMGIRPVTEPIF
jgi:hypothetical protein